MSPQRIRPPHPSDPIHLIDESPRLASTASLWLVQIIIVAAIVAVLIAAWQAY